jgi:hypothetical protein
MASFGPAILLMNAFGNKKLRNFISYACIDDQEICNKCIGFPDIVIPWTEVAEIGIGPLIHIRDGPKIAFYFSKYPIYDEKIDLSKILISDDLIWIQYSNSFCKELMRYIDITKITNYHLIEKRVEKIKRKMAK